MSIAWCSMGVVDLLDQLADIGAVEGEAPETRIERGAFVLATVLYGVLGVVWGSLYLLTGLVRSALIPYGYVVLATAVLVFLRLTGRFTVAKTGILLLWLVLPLFLQLSLGGFISGSAVVLWSIGAPIGALFFSPSAAAWWGLAFVASVVLAAAVEPVLGPPANLHPDTIRTFFVLNLVGVGTAVMLVLRDFLNRLQQARSELTREKERSEGLLLNVLPEPIADRLVERRSSQTVSTR